MKKLVLFFFLISFTVFAQSKKGFCRPEKVSPDATAQSKVTIKFLGPNGKPVLTRVSFKMNDSLVDPRIDKTGTYTMIVKPGEYSFSFYVRFWYTVNSKPIFLKSKTNTFLQVKFEPEDLSSGKK